MAHHETGLEVVEDSQPAEYTLAEYARREQQPEQHQVTPERRPEVRQHPGGQRGKCHEPGEDAIDKLDQSVRVEFGDEAILGALRPLRAAQPRTGEPHGGAAEDDQREQDQRCERYPLITLWRDREPCTHRRRG